MNKDHYRYRSLGYNMYYFSISAINIGVKIKPCNKADLLDIGFCYAPSRKVTVVTVPYSNFSYRHYYVFLLYIAVFCYIGKLCN